MRNKKISIWQLYRVIILIIALATSIWMIYNTNNEGYKYYYLVPLLFGILFFSVSPVSNNINRLGMFVLNGVVIVKYLLMPLINCMAGYSIWRGIMPSNRSIQIGIWLTIYEMVIIFMIIALFSRKYYGFSKVKLKPNRKYFIYISIIFIAIGIIFIYPQVLSKFRFILSSKEIESDILGIPLEGVINLIVDFAKVIISILIINWCKIRYDRNQNLRYTTIAMMVVVVNLCFSMGMSRWTLAVPGLIFILMLMNLFDKHRRQILLILSLTMIGGLLFLSFKKSFGVEASISESNMDIYWLADILQMYFSGPKNIAIGVESKMWLQDTINLKMLFNDLFFSVAGLSGFTDFKDTSVLLFNNRYYMSNVAHDQIIPMVAQGYIYFGYILAPIFSAINVICMMYLDKKLIQTNDMVLYYVYAYMVIWFSRGISLNITIVFSQVFNIGIVFIMIYLINKYVVVKKGRLNIKLM